MTNSPQKRSLLEKLTFGNRVAEFEPKLEEYFVETLIWRKMLRGEVDIVYGMKGVGKSALFHLLSTGRELPEDVVVIPAENTRGDPIFGAIKIEPPTSEVNFIYLWKLYILSLAVNNADVLETLKAVATGVYDQLAELGLINKDKATLISRALKYVDTISVPNVIEVKVKAPEEKQTTVDVDMALDIVNQILESKGIKIWVLFDRLDAVFDDTSDLEKNALRALFRTYQDFSKYENIRLKIFLRRDIWRALTDKGLREGSHITLSALIEWSEPNILNLVVRRLLSNKDVVIFYAADVDEILSDYKKQEEFFYRVFPKQIDPGSRKSETIRWLMSRVADGTQKVAPRELIHILNEARDEQIKALELGEPAPDGEQLFSPTAMKRALPAVSQIRMEQTIFSEYPELRDSILDLEEQKATQTKETLAKIWNVAEEKAADIASQLVEVGIFETRGDRRNPEYRVPFLYRPYLKLIQGKAEEE